MSSDEMPGLRQRIVDEMARELPIPLECATEWDDMAELVADRIIALFREALLSHRAIDKVVDSYWEEPDVPRDYGDMEKALTAALNAVIGETK